MKGGGSCPCPFTTQGRKMKVGEAKAFTEHYLVADIVTGSSKTGLLMKNK